MRRILSLDGGGIKGVFPASFLTTVEDAIGEPIGSYFDLIVGTSTGGIIALGLGLGFSAADILDFYEKLGPSVFARKRRLSRIFSARYDQDPLREALRSKFGDRRLGESSTRLVIPSLNLETGEVYIYKTAHDPRFERDYKIAAVDIALATAAAPSYFPIQQGATGIPLVDGGMWANNPTGMAVVEAIGVLNWSRDDVHVFSLGCTTEPTRSDLQQRLSRGLAYWGPRITNLFMTAQSSSSLGTAAVLIGHENIMRIDPYVAPGQFSLDGIEGISALRGLGDHEARRALPKLRRRFLTEPAEEFRPFHVLP